MLKAEKNSWEKKNLPNNIINNIHYAVALQGLGELEAEQFSSRSFYRDSM